MSDKCKHGMNPAFCSTCIRERQPQKIVKQPVQQKDTTVFGSGAVLNLAGWVVVHTPRGRDNTIFSQLDRATHVHIHGLPFLWAIERILEKAPKLRQIQVIPSMYHKLHPDAHLKICKDRGVEVVTGHIRPEMTWSKGENRSPFYAGQRNFLLSLKGEQKSLWEELLAMSFEAARMTARYFCLRGEEFVSKRVIATEYGYSLHSPETIATDLTNAVLFYLDVTFECSPRAQQMARTTKLKVGRLRKYLNEAESQRKLAIELGLERLPTDLPVARYETFKSVLEAQRSGKFGELLSERSAKALDLRFGLTSGAYLTLDNVGEQMGVTRERVRQLEELGLAYLNIDNE